MTFVNDSDDSAIAGVTASAIDFDISAAVVDTLVLGNVYKLVWTPSYPSGGFTVAGTEIIETTFTFCVDPITKVKSTATLTHTITKTCPALTAINVTPPTSSDYDNVDVTANVDFGGIWELTNASTGAVITTPAVPAAGGAITWGATEIADLVLETVYNLTFKPSYSGAGTAIKSFSTVPAEANLVLEINYCNTKTTKLSTANITF